MNRRARELGLRDTHYANPIGLDAPGNYSSARDLARLALELRKHAFVRKIADRTLGDARDRRPRRAPSRNRNTLLGQRPAGSTASRRATRRRPGYVLVGTRDAHAASRSSPSCSARRSGRRATATRSRCCAGAPGSTGGIRPVASRARWSARRPRSATAAAPSSPLVTRAGQPAHGARATRGSRTSDVGVPDEVDGPDRARAAARLPRGLADGERIADGADRRVGVRPGGRPRPAHQGLVHPAAGAARSPWLVLGGTVLVARRLRRGPPRRRAPRSEPEAA